MSDPSSDAAVFTYSFENLSALKCLPLPYNASALWRSISDPHDPVTFSQLLSRVTRNPNPAAILSSFGLAPPIRHILSTELRRHLSYLGQILPPPSFLSFISEICLDLDSFVRSLPDPSGPLLVCALHLLFAILNSIQNDATKHEIMERFSLLLVPKELLVERSKAQRPALQYLCFLPVESAKDGKQWMALCADYNKVQMFSMSKPSEAENSFTLEEVTSDLFGVEISFTSGTKPVSTYSFGSKVAAQIWEDAVARKGRDPLFHFISCLPHVFESVEYAPAEVFGQLSELLIAPDMVFLHAFMKAAATRGQEVSKGAVVSVLARINDAGMLAPWFRAVFSIEIKWLRSTTTLFRESSAASISSGVYLATLGTEFSKMVADILLENSSQVDTGIRKIIGALDKVPPVLRLVFSACFKGTRRKFQDKLVPLLAVSSFLMLRFLLPYLAMISPAASKLGQKLMSVFVFRKLQDEHLGEDIPRLIGEYLVEISHAKDMTVELPPYNAKKVLQFCAENAPLVADRVDLAIGEDEYPLHWSILELLETAIFGTREDYSKIIEEIHFFT
jgi:hypothetical protein